MGVIARVVKPRSKRSARALKVREPKAIENTKSVMFIRGPKTNETLLRVLKDLCALKKPFGQMYSKKNDFRPFEDISPIERLSEKSDSSLFLFANSNKKRPDNLIFGRLYDGHLLDMIEVGLQNFVGLSDFKNEKIPSGIKPCLLFSGSLFDSNPEMKRMKSLLIDFFRGPLVTNIRLCGLEHALSFTAISSNTIALRSYKILLKKSGCHTPRVELEEIGPSFNLLLRRSHLASEDLSKVAHETTKNAFKVKRVKNIEKDELDNTLGRVHIPKQQVSAIQTRKMKGLKKSKAKKMNEDKKPNIVEEVFMETE